MKKILSYLLIGAIFYFLLTQIISGWDEIRSAKWDLSPVDIALILLLATCINLTNAFTWHTISKGLGSKVALRDNARDWLYSNTARFLPGGIWQYPTRLLMSKKSGTSAAVSGSALLLESVFNIGVGMAITMFLGKRFLPVDNSFLYAGMFLIACLLFLFCTKRFTGALLKIARKILKKEIKIESFKLHKGYILPIILLICLQFALAGSILFILINSLTNINISNLSQFISIYAGSWLLGYLTFLAPAGLGVQELSISALLAPFLTASLAGLVAIIFRFSLLAGEVLSLFLVWLKERNS